MFAAGPADLDAVGGGELLAAGLVHFESGEVFGDLPLWAVVAALALTVVGVVVQSRGLARTRMREAWQGSAVAAR